MLTDSGKIQEEATFLKIPYLTLRPNTERPVTITQGTNKLTTLDDLEEDIEEVLNGSLKQGRIPDLWDWRTGGELSKY